MKLLITSVASLVFIIFGYKLYIEWQEREEEEDDEPPDLENCVVNPLNDNNEIEIVVVKNDQPMNTISVINPLNTEPVPNVNSFKENVEKETETTVVSFKENTEKPEKLELNRDELRKFCKNFVYKIIKETLENTKNYLEKIDKNETFLKKRTFKILKDNRIKQKSLKQKNKNRSKKFSDKKKENLSKKSFDKKKENRSKKSSTGKKNKNLPLNPIKDDKDDIDKDFEIIIHEETNITNGSIMSYFIPSYFN